MTRLGWMGDGIEVAVNGAWNDDRSVLGEFDDPRFSNVRRLLGADLRITSGPWLVSAELDRGQDQLGTSRDPWGGFLTAGYLTSPLSQLLLRLDHFDTARLGDRRTLLVGGWNYSPTRPTQIQLNGVFPIEGFEKKPQLLVQLELTL